MISTLPQVIDTSARNFPSKEAFRCGKESITFSELKRKTDQLALHLQNANVKKGDRIGIFMPRCIETCIAIYGIMKSGAAYVPLDPLAPKQRTSFLIKDCEIRHLITVESQQRKINEISSENYNLKSIVGISERSDLKTVPWKEIYIIALDTYKAVVLSENDLAYIMYTSGSTGRPKGIMHTHYSGLNYAKQSVDLYKIDSDDKVANHSPLHFDQSTFGYFSAPLAAATTVIIQDAYTKLPASLSELLEKEKISIWYSVPYALEELVKRGILEKRNLSTLRWVLFGGEVMVTKYLKELMIYWPHTRFCNVYGPAEVNQCTFYHLEKPEDITDPLPIGKVWDNVVYKIINKNGEKVDLGVSGELIVKTTTMMRGYWNNEILTNKSFHIEYNLETGQEETFYKTGDIFKENEDGNLIFLGRNDRQVKIRGYRVELDEIEAKLLLHKEVLEAAVVMIDGQNQEKKLIGVVLIDDKTKIESQNILAFCKKQLPPYAVPERIEIRENLPRTGTGKINRKSIERQLNEL